MGIGPAFSELSKSHAGVRGDVGQYGAGGENGDPAGVTTTGVGGVLGGDDGVGDVSPKLDFE